MDSGLVPLPIAVGLGLFTFVSAVWDAVTRRIPNALNVFGCAAGICLNIFLSGWQGVIAAGAGCAAGFGLSAAIYCVGAIGAGDVKWFAAAGSIAGAETIGIILLLSVLFSGLLGAAMYLISASFRAQLHQLIAEGILIILSPSVIRLRAWRTRAAHRIPFMPCAAAAAALILSGLVS